MERRKKHMRAWIARMTEDNIDQSAIEKAGEILKNGGLAEYLAAPYRKICFTNCLV